MATTVLREVVRADGAVVQLSRTTYATLSAQTWCITVAPSERATARVALFEADTLRAFDRAASEGTA